MNEFMSDLRTIRFKFDGTITFDADMPHFPDVDALMAVIAQAISAHAKTDAYLHPGARISLTRAAPKRTRKAR